MKISKTTLAAAIAATMCGCSGSRPRTDNPPPVVQAAPLSVLTAPPLSPLSPIPGMSGMVVEPAACARLASSDGQPVFEARELNCIVDWIRSVQDYLYLGGKPTKYTNEAEFNIMKKTALDMMAAQTAWLNDAKFEAKANRAVASAAVAETRPQSSSQSYLEGVIAYQKGDYVKARAAWSDALKLDPKNSDAQAGLEMLDKLSGH